MGAVKAPDGLIAITVEGTPYFVDQTAIDGLKERGISYDDGSQWNNSNKNADEAVKDFGRGAVHGATLGLADKQFGDSNQSVMQRMGGSDYNAVKERSPVASTLGDLEGSVAIPVGELGLAAKVGGKGLIAGATRVGARAAEQAAIGAATGGARSYAEGEDPSAGASVGALLGAAGSGAADLAGAAAGAGSKLIAKGLDSTADAARTRPFGIGGSDKQLAALAERFGVDKLPAKLASMIEELVPQSGYAMGHNREEYRSALDKVLEQEGPKIGELRRVMGEDQGVNALIPDEWQKLRSSLEQQLGSAPKLTQKDRAYANALEQDLANFSAKPPKDLNQLADIKSHYQEAGHSGVMGTIPDSAAAESAAMLGSKTKGTLGNLTDYALDETKAAHDLANDKFAKAALLNEQITPKAIREALNTNAAGVGSAAVGALGGAALGAAGGTIAGQDTKGSALTGGLLGLGMSTNSGTRNYMSQLLAQPRAMDTIANVARQAGIDLRKLDNSKLAKLAQIVQSYTGKVGGYIGGNSE